MQKIIPHLWYDSQAGEAAEFYTSIFENSKITNRTILPDTPSGDTEVVSFNLGGYKFMAISAGPLFKMNPSISFMLNFDPSQEENARQKLDALWNKLSEGGEVLMPLQKYPFSERYGWIQDRYGVSWQLILTDPQGQPRPFIIPSLLFVGPSYGKAEAAINFYLSIFENSKMGTLQHYGKGQEPNKEGTVMFADFMLEGDWFVAMDGGGSHNFNFNEGISLLINCEDQEEIDYYWEQLSAVPEAEQCGWLKDQFGISWQVSPVQVAQMMSAGTSEQISNVTREFLKMKKFDLAKLQAAFDR